jgi:hypothetical protein
MQEFSTKVLVNNKNKIHHGTDILDIARDIFPSELRVNGVDVNNSNQLLARAKTYDIYTVSKRSGSKRYLAVFEAATRGIKNFPPWEGERPTGFIANVPADIVNTIIITDQGKNYFCDRLYLLHALITNVRICFSRELTFAQKLSLSVLVTDERYLFPLPIVCIQKWTIDCRLCGIYPGRCDIPQHLRYI